MSDIHDRIERDENAVQKLMEDIPGFDGYRERGIRRSADKALRQKLVNRLDEIKDSLRDYLQERSRSGELNGIDDIDRLSRRLGKVRDNIRFADYGYTGFFDAIKIKTDDLDRLYQHDLSLRRQIEQCDDAITQLKQADEPADEEHIEKIDTAIAELQRLVDAREEVLTAVTPEQSQ